MRTTRHNPSPWLAVLAILCSTALASAQTFDLSWFTVDGGGEMFTTGGVFELSGTIGQPESGVVMSGGVFEMSGGFWPGAAGGGTSCAGDLDGDGDTDLADLGILLADFGCTSPGPLPRRPGRRRRHGPGRSGHSARRLRLRRTVAPCERRCSPGQVGDQLSRWRVPE